MKTHRQAGSNRAWRRFFISVLIYISATTVIFAQQDTQHTIAFELHSVGFPKNHSFQIDLQLKYFCVDTKKMALEGRRSPIAKDILLEQLSSNTHKWEITFDSKEKPIITGSPKKITFSFQRPLRELSNASGYIKLEGKARILKDGKRLATQTFRQTRMFEANATYVLLVVDNKVIHETAQPAGIAFLLLNELNDMIAGKPLPNHTRGIQLPVVKKGDNK
ncbi:MAG: hypothetical protein FWG02_11440 [Holophagaceae bacterium]|nr:hypothetical protein [Holophagaceae bacterium]